MRLILFLPETARQHMLALAALPPAYINPTLRGFHNWGVEGTENCTTGHPFFTALAQHPLAVSYHSIIATQNAADFRIGGDGVVPYWSAHLDGAASETIVPYIHVCLEKPKTVRAVMKILKGAE